MADFSPKPKLNVLSVKVNDNTLQAWKELMNEGQFTTCGQFMETLLNQYAENYSDPVKINEATAAELEATRHENESLKTQIIQQEEVTNKQAAKLEEARARIEELEAEQSQARQQSEKSKENAAGCLLIPVTPIERKCLQYLAERENRERKRNDITPEVFFIYAVREMLIKGNKFAIKSVPDGKIKEFENQLKNE